MSTFFKYSILKKYNLFLVAVLGIVIFSAFVVRKQDPKRKVKIVVIDPGHGGKDPGCSGHTHNEKAVALAVGLKLGKYIEENMKDVKVIFTRKTDVFVDLEDRAKIANDNNADLFISIHCNAAGKPVMIKDPKTGKMRAKTFKNKKGKLVVVETTNPEPYGSETYVMGLKNEEGKMKVAQRENSAILLEDNYETKYQGFDPDSQESYIIMSNYTSAYVIQSAGLAMKIQDEYSKKAGRVDKGVHRQSIWVLWRTAMPSVLTEIGYLTNPQEEKFLGSEKGQDYMASCLFRAFRKYKDEVEGTKKNYNDDLENQKPLEKEVYVSYKDSANVVENGEKENVDAKKDSLAAIEKANALNEKKYNELVAVADVALKNKNYDQAKTVYEKADALNYKGDNGYCTKKIEEIKNQIRKDEEEKERLEEQKEVNKNDLIKKYKEKARLDSIARVEKEKNDKIKTANTHTTTVNTTTNTIKSESNAVVFKVQFASSEKEIDAKLKYPNVTEVSFYKMGSTYKYTSGNYASFDDGTKQQLKLKELGYKDCFVAAFKNGVRMDINEAKKLTEKN